MKRHLKNILAGLALVACLGGPSASAQPLQIPGRGKDIITFPNGKASFADRVVHFQVGSPAPADPTYYDPTRALGVPSGSKGTDNCSLGKGGTLVLEFTDNRLVDVGGPDLFIFEDGPSVERTFIDISVDGNTWYEIGDVSGGRAYVDIRPHIPDSTMQFRFVRLRDDPNQGDNGRYAGADINAVGAIGSIDYNESANAGKQDGGSKPVRAEHILDAVTFFLPGQNQGAWGDTYPQRITAGVDADRMGGGALQLGDGGTVVALSSSGVIKNASGPDIVIYGELVGPVQVDVSADGRSWTTIGTATSSSKALDLGSLSEAKFVRLTDQVDSLSGSRIDAIGAVEMRYYR
ncbi:MAG: hypothetical protein KC910_31420 [Candidatus Eremiobacteraeota bacterium]|nr:hypothetical protein [Candidatus Eremiobacteraeota bacterium]